MPERIQRRRTKGWRLPDGAVYVGRPGRFGNPFKVGTVIDRIAFKPRRDQAPRIIEVKLENDEQVVEAYRQWLRGRGMLCGGHNPAPDPPTLEEIRAALAGKDLACWCPDSRPCHATLLLELANETS